MEMGNDRISNHGHTSYQDKRVILLYVFEIVQAKALNNSLHHIPKKVKKLISWIRPPEGVVKLNTDGASKCIQGAATAEGLIRDASGRWLSGF